MNRTIVRTTCRERLSHPVRLGGLLGAFLLPLVTTLFDPDPQLAEPFWAMGFAVILSAGLIGLEITSGSLSLVFTRPVGRGAYAVSRWAAVAGLAIAAAIAQLCAQAAILRSAGHAVPLELLAWNAVDRATLAAGVSAVFLFFSSMTTSVADLFLWAGGNVIAGVLMTAGRIALFPTLGRAGRGLALFLNPSFDLYQFTFSSPHPWANPLRYVVSVFACLIASAWILNRRELSYASG